VDPVATAARHADDGRDQHREQGKHDRVADEAPPQQPQRRREERHQAAARGCLQERGQAVPLRLRDVRQHGLPAVDPETVERVDEVARAVP
jgi:hypothetical protein